MIGEACSILIADAALIVQEGLAAVIARTEGLTLVGMADNGGDAAFLFRHYTPDVMILDLLLPGIAGVEVIAIVRRGNSHTRCLVFTASETESDICTSFRAGAAGYLFKTAEIETLVQAISVVSSGNVYEPEVVAAKIADHKGREALSRREHEVLACFVEGQSNQEIGHALDICEGTVKTHVSKILAKLGVKSRLQAVIVALQRGFLPELARV